MVELIKVAYSGNSKRPARDKFYLTTLCYCELPYGIPHCMQITDFTKSIKFQFSATKGMKMIFNPIKYLIISQIVHIL